MGYAAVWRVVTVSWDDGVCIARRGDSSRWSSKWTKPAGLPVNGVTVSASAAPWLAETVCRSRRSRSVWRRARACRDAARARQYIGDAMASGVLGDGATATDVPLPRTESRASDLPLATSAPSAADRTCVGGSATSHSARRSSASSFSAAKVPPSASVAFVATSKRANAVVFAAAAGLCAGIAALAAICDSRVLTKSERGSSMSSMASRSWSGGLTMPTAVSHWRSAVSTATRGGWFSLPAVTPRSMMCSVGWAPRRPWVVPILVRWRTDASVRGDTLEARGSSTRTSANDWLRERSSGIAMIDL
mmetsp:Transcript_22428/g.69559  ORF Transcript_22428/g.69559 Transcript_22428/m.69559 type:complete len:305 (+) Transcript_22428:526-1440(+)